MGKIRVGVIGGGAAGLCAGRNMMHEPRKFDFVIFEQWHEVGGTWNYTDMTDVDQYQLPIHSSMYENLKTNVPKEIMGFPDYPFPDNGHSFTHHTNVLNYLKNYATKHNLYDKIKFRHHVISVTPENAQEKAPKWRILVKDLLSNEEKEYIFDAVMICNGHYAVPNIPDIPNIGKFQGEQIHSHSYRSANMFHGKTVIVLGAASSGMDISMEIASVAKKVYLSHNLPQNHTCQLPSNVTQVPGIQSAHEIGFVLKDGARIDADTLLFCTGYHFSFPFLTEKCKVVVSGSRVMPLYKHLIHIEFPTLCFIGLPFTVLPFPMFHYQTQYFLRTLDGTITLPGKTEMLEDTEKDFETRIKDMQMPPKHAHKMGPLQWGYFQELGNEVHCSILPPVYQKIYEKVEEERKENVMWYKREDYRVLSAEEYERTMPGRN